MVQFRMDERPAIPTSRSTPSTATARCALGQGREARRPAGRLRRPRIARGYFEAGFHQTEAWYDLADGKRRMKHRPALEILETD